MSDQFLNAAVDRVAAQVATALAAQSAEPFDPTLAASRRAEYETARQQARLAREQTINALRQLDTARDALAAAQAEGRTADLAQLEAALAAAADNVTLRRQQLSVARADVTGRHSQLVNAHGTASAARRLERGIPIVLLPVRLETRYFAKDSVHYELRLRIFPDAVQIDDHQPLMSDDEQAAARGYWTVRLAEGPEAPATLAAWHEVCERVGEPRAAWLVAELDPFGEDGRGRPTAGAIPPIPTPSTAPEGWVDVAQARCLPDRWVAVGYHDDKRVLLHWGGPVDPELQVSLDPTAPDDADLDPGLRWVTDFDAAEAAGMAMRITIEKTIARHLDRLIVFGISASEDKDAGSQRIAALMASHAATGAGLPAYGTPTNNTERQRSGHRERPRDHVARHAELLQTALGPLGDRDGECLARAFGIDPGVFRRAHDAGRRGLPGVEDMHRVLWYATWQRLLEVQIETSLSADAIAFARDHFIRYVRPHGPVPLLRVESQPYGVLPVVSLDRWSAPATDGRLRIVVNVLRTIRNALFRFEDAPTPLPEDGDPQGSLLNILSGSASAFVTEALSKYFNTQALADSTAANMQPWWNAAGPLLAQGPLDLQNAYGGRRLWYRSTGRRTDSYDTARALVLPGADPMTPMPDSLNFIARLAAFPSLSSVRNHQIPGASAKSVLYLLLREGYESVPGFTLELHTLFFQALYRLKDLPVAELEALTTGVIDAATHRTDAWVTSIANRRLSDVRSANRDGVHVGGYGWIEGLVPPGEGTVAGAPITEDPDSAGFIHLPSAAQARTAAVLHGAFLAHGAQGANDSLRIDLSSSRVRLARWLLVGLREGQPLAALLGSRFERRLVERGFGQHIPTLRRIASVTVGPTRPADSTSDRSIEDPATTEIVDGVVIGHLHANGTLDDRLRAHQLPRNEMLQIVGLAAEIAEAYDALSDLMMAEGVHQALSGNASRAAAAFDTMAEGAGTAPEPAVSATSVGGQQIGQRVLVPLPVSATTGWPGDETRPRAVAEPRLNAWAAALFGAPEAVGFTVRPAPDLPPQAVTLAGLDLCPLDLVHLTAARAEASPLMYLLKFQFGWSADAQIDLSDPGGAAQCLEHVLALAYALQRVVKEARPLRAADLRLGAGDSVFDMAELAGRAAATMDVMTTLASALAAETSPGPAIWKAAVLLGVADPGAPTTLPALRAGLARRLADAAGAGGPLPQLEILAGNDLKVLPLFMPANGDELAMAFADQDALTEADRTRPRRWLNDYARVRVGVETLDLLVTLSSTLGRSDALTVTHLPYAAGHAIAWAGERLPETGEAPRLSLLAHTPFAVDYTAPVAGLMVDSWTDTTPRRTALTGLAFNYDAPKPQAPQAILIAVPPDRNRDWAFEDIESTLTETLDLVRLRLMNPTELGALGDYLPALYLIGDMRADLEDTQ